MRVKASKVVETGGKKYKSGDVIDVNDSVAQKLIDRGLAKIDSGKSKED